jgi:hypothetical protein
MGTADNRTTFVQAVLDLVTTFDLDGIDFEYVEYAFHIQFVFNICILAAGNIQIDRVLAAIQFRQMIAPTSYPFFKSSENNQLAKISHYPLLSLSRRLLAPTGIP